MYRRTLTCIARVNLHVVRRTHSTTKLAHGTLYVHAHAHAVHVHVGDITYSLITFTFIAKSIRITHTHNVLVYCNNE